MVSEHVPVWFITGCSSGFGRALATLVLEQGWRAAVTARDPSRVDGLVARHDGRGLALALDVTDPAQIAAAVHAAEARFGAIDVLVNNAGYGYETSVEEGDDVAVRALFETNVFGLAALMRAVLPGMRTRRRGYIVNFSSVAGFVGFPAFGYYAATKHAVEGLSDALAKEVGPLGIHVMCVEPGPFRTDFAGRSVRQTLSRFGDYESTVNARLRTAAIGSGTQPGDPVRAAAAIIEAVQAAQPPRHLVLGAMGIENVRKSLAETLEEIDTWKQTSLAADYPMGQPE
jgi:NAD(P)-dependent dehydrogenase (short-subunit alcohol dehydrogenase family)